MRHNSLLQGDPARTGVTNRWSWTCDCGYSSFRKDLTVAEARASFDAHVAQLKLPWYMRRDRGPATCVFCRRIQTYKVLRSMSWWSCSVAVNEATFPVCPRDQAKLEVRRRVGKLYPASLLDRLDAVGTDPYRLTEKQMQWAFRIAWERRVR